MAVGTLLGIAGAAGWLVWRSRWHEKDPNDPGRVLAEEVGATVLLRARRWAPAADALRSAFGKAAPEHEPALKTKTV